jgi:hypothetical protein
MISWAQIARLPEKYNQHVAGPGANRQVHEPSREQKEFSHKCPERFSPFVVLLKG